MTWWNFIYKNMIDGTVKEISDHIQKKNKELNFRPNNKHVDATVEFYLPLHADGRIKSNSKRKQVDSALGYDSETKRYYKKEVIKILKKTLLLYGSSSERHHSNNENNDDINIKRSKNISKKHIEMLDVIEKYARQQESQGRINGFEIEKILNIDYLEEKKDKVTIYEVKSYEEGVFTAIGQLLFYQENLSYNYDVKKIDLCIVGNFNLPDKFITVLNKNNIKFKHIDDFK